LRTQPLSMLPNFGFGGLRAFRLRHNRLHKRGYM
jgi:hypothetical protein